ncbi:hypothetical protein AX774_g7206 [Zancudomyces culisetae]|uniref:Uncharacterized protein n=1 Tax=Zancudomyces culisetae TaxID=1213189 RepID=A0A1R1PEJ6_ZANCU|nr:hypothetical protein AX774_g7206 [Zancudomyces culisetae]|eukprot:OMH79394.1 hypothetical protein AX774_g7206 [Zancudomyces culisetae]
MFALNNDFAIPFCNVAAPTLLKKSWVFILFEFGCCDPFPIDFVILPAPTDPVLAFSKHSDKEAYTINK